MPTNTADQGIQLPVDADTADAPVAFASQTSTIESRLAKRYTNLADRTARNPTPTAGEYSFLTTPGRWDHYNGAAWMENFPLFARKANETQLVNNSVAFVNDDQLLVPLQIGTYEFRCMIIQESGTTADFAAGPIMITGTATSIDWQSWNFSTAGVFFMDAFTASNTFAVQSSGIGSTDPFYMTGLVVCTVAGNFGVRWSQNALQAVNTRVKIGSFIVAQRVA
jgi:hypothetical protein